MYDVKTRRPPPQHRPTKAECCVDLKCESGLKNNYFEGKRLTADAFRVEQRYLVERRRLLNRAIHGWGVVYGYSVKSSSGQLEIGPGLALDQCGRELLQTTVLSKVNLGDVIRLDEKDMRVQPSDDWNVKPRSNGTGKVEDPRCPVPTTPPPSCWLLSIHYAEQDIAPFPINDPCSCERLEWDHVCETVRYSLKPIDCDKCCDKFPCELTCDCGTGPCCDQYDADANGKTDRQHDYSKTEISQHAEPHSDDQRKDCKPFTRGGCQCLCEHLTNLQPGGEHCSLCEIEEPCARVRVDLRHAVPLACVMLVQDECDQWTFDAEIEPCGPRRLVKRNDLLFDLIRGCDLTRVKNIGWAKWHRSPTPIPWADFQGSFGTEDSQDSGRNVTDYTLEFSRQVQANTVRPDCFTMTITVAEDEAGWGEMRRVPIIGVDTWGGTIPGHITHARLIVDAGWVHDATVSRKTIFNQDEALVEIEFFGDYVVDCNGQTVDANVRELCAVPTGNGTPGGTLRSSFRVAVRGSQERTSPHTPSAQGA